MAVVKSDAYGHGVQHVALRLQEWGVQHFGVACVEEGLALRAMGIGGHIYILSTITKAFGEEMLRQKLIPTISSLEMAHYVVHLAEQAQQTLVVHVKVDSGMSRCGALPGEVVPILQTLAESAYIQVGGIYSHLATADEANSAYAQAQEEVFLGLLRDLSEKGYVFPHVHLSNSAALITRSMRSYSLARIGCLLYGALPAAGMPCDLDLKPVMELSAQVVQVKTVPAGLGVSYGCTHQTQAETRVAIIDTGYAHGLDRRMSNGGKVLINGQKRPIIGTVCMDLTIVELSKADQVNVGDRVYFDVSEMAQTTGTIAYEVLCRAGYSARITANSNLTNDATQIREEAEL